MMTNDKIREALAMSTTRRTFLRQQVGEINREIVSLTAHMKTLTEFLQAGRAYELTISDHATVRYVERHLGFNPAELAALVQEKVEPAAGLLGDGIYPLTDGLVAVVRNRTVLTIKPA